MSGTDHDYADDGTAWVHREIKATELARWCWNHHVHPADLMAADRALLNRIARIVGVNPPREGSPTWPQVQTLLTAKAAWAHRNPDDPRAHPTHPRPDWLTPAEPTQETTTDA